jgi:hypothetical protein
MHVDADMPTPKGMVEVQYLREANGVSAQITLPTGVSGELVWKGHETAVREGKQTLVLP